MLYEVITILLQGFIKFKVQVNGMCAWFAEGDGNNRFPGLNIVVGILNVGNMFGKTPFP